MLTSVGAEEIEYSLKYHGRYSFQKGYFYLNRQRSASWILMWCDPNDNHWVIGPLSKRGVAVRHAKKSSAVEEIIKLCERSAYPSNLVDPATIGITKKYEPLSEIFKKRAEVVITDGKLPRNAQLQMDSIVQQLAELKARVSYLESQLDKQS